MTLLGTQSLKAEILNELSRETCFEEDETAALARREKQCQTCEKNIESCQWKFEEVLKHGYKEPTIFDSKILWFVLGGVTSAIAIHNLGGK